MILFARFVVKSLDIDWGTCKKCSTAPYLPLWFRKDAAGTNSLWNFQIALHFACALFSMLIDDIDGSGVIGLLYGFPVMIYLLGKRAWWKARREGCLF